MMFITIFRTVLLVQEKGTLESPIIVANIYTNLSEFYTLNNLELRILVVDLMI